MSDYGHDQAMRDLHYAHDLAGSTAIEDSYGYVEHKTLLDSVAAYIERLEVSARELDEWKASAKHDAMSGADYKTAWQNQCADNLALNAEIEALKVERDEWEAIARLFADMKACDMDNCYIDASTALMSQFMRVVAKYHGSNNARTAWSDYPTFIHTKCPDCDRLTTERDEWEAIARVLAKNAATRDAGRGDKDADGYISWAREQVQR